MSLQCAGKTGTTNGKMDAWFCGYTKPYTTAIWVGDDDNKKTNIAGGSVATIWQAFNQAVINKKRLSPSSENNIFDLQIIDNSEPEQILDVIPTETSYILETIDPLMSIQPSNEWEQSLEPYSADPYSFPPIEEEWQTNTPPTEPPLEEDDDDDWQGNNGHGNGSGNNNGNGFEEDEEDDDMTGNGFGGWMNGN